MQDLREENEREKEESKKTLQQLRLQGEELKQAARMTEEKEAARNTAETELSSLKQRFEALQIQLAQQKRMNRIKQRRSQEQIVRRLGVHWKFSS